MTDDPITPEALREAYRRYSTPYLERRLLEFQTAEAYNRSRCAAIETVRHS